MFAILPDRCARSINAPASATWQSCFAHSSSAESSCSRVVGWFRYGLMVAFAMGLLAGMAQAEDTAGIKSKPGRKKVKVWPPEEEKKSEEKAKPRSNSVEIGGWIYTAIQEADVQGNVPWRLIVTPNLENASKWRKGDPVQKKSLFRHSAEIANEKAVKPDTIPVIRMPQTVWKIRMAADLQTAVGIHFHEYVSDDVARILYTLHKVPADGPDGKPPKLESYKGQTGTRIEATLLAPVIYSLDQSIVVRLDNETIPNKQKQDETTQGRVDHEVGHANVSQQVLLQVLRGPQNWDLEKCVGRRSHLDYYWKKERIGRSWEGYERGVGKLVTLRTSVALVPPTRWSMLLPIPPERVTQKHLQQFNDAIVMLGPIFAAADAKAQDDFHAQHGEYEAPVTP